LTSKTFSHSERIINLGRVKSANGIYGELRVTCFGSMLSLLKEEDNVQLYESEGAKDGFLINPKYIVEYSVHNITNLRNNLLSVKLKEINTRKDAEDQKGRFFGLSLPEAKKKFVPHENDYYLFHLIDLQVKDQNSNDLEGHVERIEESAAQTWLLIRLKNIEKLVMAPLESHFVLKIDFSKNLLFTQNLADLIE